MPQMTSIAAIEKPSTPTPYFSLNSSITQIITDWRTPRNSAEESNASPMNRSLSSSASPSVNRMMVLIASSCTKPIARRK
ncbi:hypothetical protein D3C71_1556210 [compost metagenome]